MHLSLIDEGGGKVLTQCLSSSHKGELAALERGAMFKHLWKLLTNLNQDILNYYTSFESQFVDLWVQWVSLQRQGKFTLNFLIKDQFVARQFLSLKEKVRERFLANYNEAIEVAHLKDKKLYL